MKEDDMVDLEQFREAVDFMLMHGTREQCIRAGDMLQAIIDNAHQPAPVVDDAMVERALNAKVGYLSVRQLFACEREARQGARAILTAAQQPAAVVDEAMVERALDAKVGNWPVRQLFDSECEARIAMRAALTAALSSAPGAERE